MPEKILIAYATKYGSTAGIATTLGEALSARGLQVDVRPVREVRTLEGYDAVILGSPVYMGNWLSESVAFVRTHQAELSRLPVALFTVHMLNQGEDETSRAARQGYTAPIRALLPGAQEMFFAGKIDYYTLSFFDRLITRLVAKQSGQSKPVNDLRDWEKIRRWAEEVFA